MKQNEGGGGKERLRGKMLPRESSIAGRGTTLGLVTSGKGRGTEYGDGKGRE